MPLNPIPPLKKAERVEQALGAVDRKLSGFLARHYGIICGLLTGYVFYDLLIR
jgi:hypothetical protein